MTNQPGGAEREWAYFSDVLDPVIRELVACEEPWDAYQRALAVCGLIAQTWSDSCTPPHRGSIYIAWAELTDLFETGRTSVEEAHSTLRDAALRWLDRPSTPTDGFLEPWIAWAQRETHAVFARDGHWWREPS